MEEVLPDVEEITIIVGVARQPKKRRLASAVKFWRTTGPLVESVAQSQNTLDQFEDAQVFLENGKPVDLLQQLVTWKNSVPADEHKHIDEQTIVMAIQEAYREHRPAIRAALGVQGTS